MLLLRPEVYAKLMKSFEFEQNMSDLDRNMKTILSDSNLDEVEKWIHYRQQLITHANKWRHQQNEKTNKKSFPLPLSANYKPDVRDNSTQMYRKTNKNMETQTNHLIDKDDYMTSMNIINNAILDEEISNIDVDQLTSPTNRLSLSTSEPQKHVSAKSIASALKKQRPAATNTDMRRALSFDNSHSEDAPTSETRKNLKRSANKTNVDDDVVAVRPKSIRSHLKRSAAQPDQLEIDFPVHKKIARRNQLQTGTSIRDIKWTRI